MPPKAFARDCVNDAGPGCGHRPVLKALAHRQRGSLDLSQTSCFPLAAAMCGCYGAALLPRETERHSVALSFCFSS